MPNEDLLRLPPPRKPNNPESGPIGTVTADGRVVCGARNKHNGAFCQRAPAAGRTRCKLHGGASPRGVDSPAYRTGHKSQLAQDNLLARIERAATDPEATSLRREIATIDSQLAALTEQLSEAEDAYARGATGTTMSPYDLRSQLGALMELKRRLSATEQKRCVLNRDFLTREEATVFLSTVVNIVDDLGLTPEQDAKFERDMDIFLHRPRDLRLRPRAPQPRGSGPTPGERVMSAVISDALGTAVHDDAEEANDDVME